MTNAMPHRRWALAPFAVLVLCVLGGCNNPERWRFREEVILNDGTRVVLSRIALRNNVWPRLGEGGYRSVVNQWLTYPPLSVDLELAQLGDHAYPLFSLGVVEGKPHVAALPKFVTLELGRYCAAHPDKFRAYFWAKEGASWREVEQTDLLLDTLTYNLLHNVEWGESAPQAAVLTLDDKSAKASHDFRKKTTAREFLSAQYGKRCDYKG